jgi:hypothetical protein
VSVYSGYFYIVDEQKRGESLEELIYNKGAFTDAISVPDWEAKCAEIFLLSLDGETLHSIALVKRSSKVATQKWRISFSNFHILEPTLPIAELLENAPGRVQAYLVHSSKTTGARIPPRTWSYLIEAIEIVRPGTATAVHRLETLRREGTQFFRREGSQVTSEERDAVNLSLRISGFGMQSLLEWMPPTDGVAPFLLGLPQITLNEDQMLHHDSEIFGDWQLIRRNLTSTVEFSDGTRRLTVMNVNRHKIEQTLGVDLIYYHHDFNAYVMVQYKRLIRSDDVPFYRPIDHSYQAEIQRMEEFQNQFPPQTGKTLLDYRLNSQPFYFKLCESEIFDLTSTSMIKGMYISLDYWKELMDSPGILGKRQGKFLTYSNVKRYLDNKLFITLVKAGWIGSVNYQSNTLTGIIRNSLETGKSVILADFRHKQEPIQQEEDEAAL